MVVSYYFTKYPYKALWRAFRKWGRQPDVVAYCAHPIDYVILKPVLKHLPPVSFLPKDRKTARYLAEQGVRVESRFTFPKAVLMCRHAAHRFPEERILKIGFRHGAYHFKEFCKARYYNAFDLFFTTSTREVEMAEARGIRSTLSVGFPKLDPAFDGSLSRAVLDRTRKQCGVEPDRKTVLFTTTWDKSGMSAVDRWVDRLPDVAERYRVLVTVHPSTSKKVVSRIKGMERVFFIDDPDVLPYLMIADVLVGDTSSIIAEFCALDKPMVTFRVGDARRLTREITDLLGDISVQIERPDQLIDSLERCLKYPDEKRQARLRANARMFDALDGQAGKRAADIVMERYPILRSDQSEKA